MEKTNIKLFDFIVVGGGIAGISTIEQISHELPSAKLLLLTASSHVRFASIKQKLTKNIDELEIKEHSVEEFSKQYSQLEIVIAKLQYLSPNGNLIEDSHGNKYHYNKICICTGGVPKLIFDNNPYVIGLRDTDSAINLQKKLCNSKRVCIAGNGGIATELVYQLTNVELVWVIRDSYISSVFLDAGAAEFFTSVALKKQKKEANKVPKTMVYTASNHGSQSGVPGCSLGPCWHHHIELHGGLKDMNPSLIIEYNAEILDVTSQKLTEDNYDWPVYLKLNNGKVYGCDFIISATGISPSVPRVEDHPSFDLDVDGGISVNEYMETNIKDVFAAGDVCSVNWDIPFHWFQMRLWSQGRLMGAHAGRCMVSSFLKLPRPIIDFGFELFIHVTQFFGFKVILLGLFNGQKLNGEYEALIRVTKDLEYVKLVVRDGKIHGALLVGETDMEETAENLILNQLDISAFGEEILNPDVDIDDFFD